jgi:EAL domain-containing protein (putative c-di-GMP-specific phosphodiesterase class I)
MSGSVTRKTFGRIRGFLRGDGISIAFQPIADLDTGSVLGFEALARFDAEPSRSPAAWFRDASEAGLRRELELATVRAAVAAIEELPPGTYMTVNASPDVAASSAFADAIAGAPAGRLVVEITEHAPVEDYETLNRALQLLRSRGARVAIDDAGAGFANMAHMLRLNVDLIKLDIELTRHIDIDSKRKALVASLVKFAASVGATIVAEGIETEAELHALRRLGVRVGQGFHLGRPEVLEGAARPGPARARRTVAQSIADAFLSRAHRVPRESRPAGRRRIVRPVALALIAVLLWPAAAAYAETALPGSAGWWLKRRIEDARLMVALDRTTEIKLQLDFARRRLNEVSELVARGDSSRAKPALGDYQNRVAAVRELLPGPSSEPVTAELHERIESDLVDYVETLTQQEGAVCETDRRSPCSQIGSSSERSKATLEHVARLPKRRRDGRRPGPDRRSRRDGERSAETPEQVPVSHEEPGDDGDGEDEDRENRDGDDDWTEEDNNRDGGDDDYDTRRQIDVASLK